ncbi:MAG: hypothetical protein ABF449_08540, partial [Ethanoligenens sp.]
CVLLVGVIFLAGCQTQLSPKDTVTTYFKAIKSLNIATMESLSVNGTSSDLESLIKRSSSSMTSSDIQSGENIYKAIFNKVDTKIEGDPTVKDNSASVKVKITAPDAKKILQDIMSEEISKAFANALNSSAGSQDTESEIMNEFQNKISQPDVSLTTTEMNLQLVKQKDKWKVKTTDNLIDAMTGNMISYAKDLSSLASSSSSANS